MAKSTAFIAKSSKRHLYGKITVMTLVAVFIALVIVSIANDVYAFIKKDVEVVLTIDELHSISELGYLLEEHGIISNPHIFTIYAKSNIKDKNALSFSNPVTLNRSMSYREILLVLANKK